MALVLRGGSAVMWHASKNEFPYFQGTRALSAQCLAAVATAMAPVSLLQHVPSRVSCFCSADLGLCPPSSLVMVPTA